MSDLIRQVQRVATRTLKNRCFLCQEDIRKGQGYVSTSHADSGRAYSIYEHETCRNIFHAYMSEAYPYEDWDYCEGELLDVLDDLPEGQQDRIRRLREG